jgi:hypothetical protein
VNDGENPWVKDRENPHTNTPVVVRTFAEAAMEIFCPTLNCIIDLMGTVNNLKLTQSSDRHKFHLAFRACHLCLAGERDSAIGAVAVTYREFPEAAQLD